MKAMKAKRTIAAKGKDADVLLRLKRQFQLDIIERGSKELISKTLDEVLQMFENHPELKQIDNGQGCVYWLVKGSIARRKDAGL